MSGASTGNEQVLYYFLIRSDPFQLNMHILECAHTQPKSHISGTRNIVTPSRW